MDLRVMSPSGFQDDRRAPAAFLTTLPRCGATNRAGLFRSSPESEPPSVVARSVTVRWVAFRSAGLGKDLEAG